MNTTCSRSGFSVGSRLLLGLVAFAITTNLSTRSAVGLVVPNTFGQGADAGIGNDSAFAGTALGGAANAAEIRSNDTATNRNRLGLFRFDISQASGNLSGAIVKFYETGNNSRTVTVYGLNDGDTGEAWEEATITYDNAPGISLISGTTPATAFDPSRTTLLGTFNTTASAAENLQFSSPELDTFIAADTNGLVSLYLYRDGGGGVVVRTKEFNYTGTVGAVPTIEFPNVVPEPGSTCLVLGGMIFGLMQIRRRHLDRNGERNWFA